MMNICIRAIVIISSVLLFQYYGCICMSIEDAMTSRNLDNIKEAVKQIKDINTIFTKGPLEGYTPLTHAVANKCDLNIVKYLVEDCKANVETQSNIGSTTKTPLHFAVFNFNFKAVNYLLEQGAKIDTLATGGDCNGLTALQIAGKDMAYQDYEKKAKLSAQLIIKKLIESGKVDKIDTKKIIELLTPPNAAAINKQAIELFVRNAEYSTTPETELGYDETDDSEIETALKARNCTQLNKIFKSKTNINSIFTTGSIEFLGHTPLTYAVEHNLFDVVKCLIKLGADVNTPNNINEIQKTPLHLAILNLNPKIVRVLLQYGAKLETKIINGRFTEKTGAELLDEDESIQNFDQSDNCCCFYVIARHCIDKKKPNKYKKTTETKPYEEQSENIEEPEHKVISVISDRLQDFYEQESIYVKSEVLALFRQGRWMPSVLNDYPRSNWRTILTTYFKLYRWPNIKHYTTHPWKIPTLFYYKTRAFLKNLIGRK